MAEKKRRNKPHKKAKPINRIGTGARRDVAERPPDIFGPGTGSALAVPLRVHILTEIADRQLTAATVARECAVPVSKVAYHFRVLENCGCVAVAETRQKRGAVERVYRATSRLIWTSVVLDRRAWNAMNEIIKSARERIADLEIEAAQRLAESDEKGIDANFVLGSFETPAKKRRWRRRRR